MGNSKKSERTEAPSSDGNKVEAFSPKFSSQMNLQIITVNNSINSDNTLFIESDIASLTNNIGLCQVSIKNTLELLQAYLKLFSDAL